MGKLELAVSSFLAAIEINNKVPETYNRLGDAYNGLGRIDLAAKAYEDSLAIADNREARRRLAQIYLQMNQFERASPLIDALVLEDPRDLDLLALKAYSLIDRKQFGEGAQWLKRALDINPRHVPSLYYRGLLNHKMKDLVQAAADLEQAAAIDPKQVMVGITLAQVYLESGQTEEADATIERLVKNLPADSPDVEKIRTSYQSRRQNQNLSTSPWATPPYWH